MKLQNLIEGDDWSVWFDSRESYAGKSKVIGFTRRGSYDQVLVDLHYKDGKPQITTDQFVSLVKKNANLQKSVANPKQSCRFGIRKKLMMHLQFQI